MPTNRMKPVERLVFERIRHLGAEHGWREIVLTELAADLEVALETVCRTIKRLSERKRVEYERPTRWSRARVRIPRDGAGAA